jgi:hypothetical protein
MPAPGLTKRIPLWLSLVLLSGLPRILGAFLLPNAFGDAYVYVRDASAFAVKISAGTFRVTDLYGFWLPLYQLICALVIAVVGHPYYVAKVISALFGVGVCLLVHDITLRLTANRKAALCAFALIAFSPLHIFNSASSMTDIPSAFFVVASLYFALKRRWIVAAVLAALAGLTRIDNWMLIVLLPAIQILYERRVSIVSILILIFPPLFWFYISWLAAGNWLACFIIRKQYMDALLAANPSLASFSVAGVARDSASLLISIDVVVLVACVAAAWWMIRRVIASRNQIESEALLTVASISIYFFAFVAFIVLAYLTHKQPIIFPRYGLTMFAIGMPVLPWAYLDFTRRKPHLARKLLIAIVVVCVFEVGVQLVGSIGFINKMNTLRTVAEYVQSNFKPKPNTRIFSDEGTVVALSGIPEANFLASADAPRERQAFVSWLKEKNVEYLVFVEKEDSVPAKLFPDLKKGIGNEMFTPVTHASARFLRTNVWVYRVHFPSN